MFGDLQLVMSDEQDLSAGTGTVLSSKSIDLGAAGTVPGQGGSPIADLMRGNQPKLLVQVVEGFDSSGGASTIKVELISTDDALTGSLTVLDETAAIAEASLVSGYKFRVNFPEKITQRYIGLRYTIGGETTTLGTISAWLLLDTSSAHPLG